MNELANSKKTGPFQIAFVFDENYVYPFFVTLYSLIASTQSEYKVIIAFNDRFLGRQSRALVSEFADIFSLNLSFLEIEDLEGLPTSNGFNTTPYGKIIMIKYLSGLFAYLDCDTLVTCDISELFTIENEPDIQQVISACIDPWGHQQPSQNQAVIKAGNRYFNSGVLLINSDGWKLKNLDGQLPELLTRYKELNFEWPDQCTLNYLVSDHYKQLDERFNTYVTDTKAASMKAKILHYSGSHRKPWRIPMNYAHRLFYLQERTFRLEYRLYLRTENQMFRQIRRKNSNLAKRLRALRRNEFRKANHIFDLLLIRFEASRLGPFVKFLHRNFAFKR